nr:MAG TPA: hypothetical protein [Caudoviricetes sp.]DAZ01037.1 MAG TPA: hypothetical protein [Caudoviricetes sp.]
MSGSPLEYRQRRRKSQKDREVYNRKKCSQKN